MKVLSDVLFLSCVIHQTKISIISTEIFTVTEKIKFLLFDLFLLLNMICLFYFLSSLFAPSIPSILLHLLFCILRKEDKTKI